MIVDLFAGCGGWDVGARLAGLDDPIGFELDAAACATRAAAQMPTVRADIAGYPPRGTIEGLIASPPCTDFSTAGKRAGRDGTTGHMVDVPLAWALCLRPEWLAWEQVPPVLPIWEQHAYALERIGYFCWTGIVCAADYGVPQTRRRAVLLARRDRRPCPPMPTHCETGGMFTERWLSMADALGWTEDGYGAITLDRRVGGNGAPKVDVLNRPAPTLLAGKAIAGSQWQVEASWPYDKPATTVCADPRLSPPGYRGRPDDYAPDGTYNGERSMDNAIRLTVRDALILQSFPPDFPVQGTRTAQFRQIGNAVPPVMAARLLEAVSGP